MCTLYHVRFGFRLNYSMFQKERRIVPRILFYTKQEHVPTIEIKEPS